MNNYRLFNDPSCQEFLSLLKYDSDFFIKRCREARFWERWANILGEQRYLNLNTWHYIGSDRLELIEFTEFIDNNGFKVTKTKSRGEHWNFFIIADNESLESHVMRGVMI